jgi:hypothetical protein
MGESIRLRLLCALVGGLIGFGTGFVFFAVTESPRGPFPLFLPVVFAAVFAFVASIAAEKLFPILLELLLGFLFVGGGAYLWHHFSR